MKKHKRRNGTRSKGHGKNPRQSALKPPETWEAKRLRQYQAQKAMDDHTTRMVLELMATLGSTPLRKAEGPNREALKEAYKKIRR